jgi:ABC-type nickel/cobalt efflux system permease component RcnA
MLSSTFKFLVEQTAPFSDSPNWLLQASGIGLIISVAFWFIQRGDKRETIKEQHYTLELQKERDSHDKTREELKEVLKEFVKLQKETRNNE